MKQSEMKELIGAMEELEKEKGISKDYLIESLETALVTAYKKNFDSVDNVKVTIDSTKGTIKVFAVKTVVENVEDELLEISLEDAKKINKKAKLEETVEQEIIPKDFGRIAAQTAKQVMLQKIREAERNILYTQFNDKKGEIVSGIIQKADSGIVVMDLGRLE